MPVRESIQLQRILTSEFILKRRLHLPVIWLKPLGVTPSSKDAVTEGEKLGVDIREWEPEDERNLGVRLVDGHIELKIKSPDETWTKRLIEACLHLKVDVRAAYGLDLHPVSSILIRIDPADSIDRWNVLWPQGWRDKSGRRVETSFVYSAYETPRTQAVWRVSSPLPGSILGGHLTVWRPNLKPAAELVELGVEDLETRQLAAAPMDNVVRAIAYATLSYWIDAHLDGLTDWDVSLTNMIGGWLARVVSEGKDINARGKSLEGVCWAPIDSAAMAGDLIKFLTKKSDLGARFEWATRELEANPITAKVSGWPALEGMLGRDAKIAIRRTMRAGLDLDAIEAMSEQYVFNISDNVYVDREALLNGLPYTQKKDDLVARYENQLVFVRGKPLNPFRLYAASSLRTDVQRSEFFPGREPAAILRYSRVHGLVLGEERQSDEYPLINVYRGFSIKPVAAIDQAIMREAVSMLDEMLALLTKGNDAQMLWLKKFIAQIAQHPEIKPQVCPIIVGGQGIGKSVFGEDLMRGLFGEMAGSADAASLADNKFLITPFIGMLITFIDEVRLESVGAINTIKKLVRADTVSGQVKFGHQHDHYIPSRLLIASNSPDIGLTSADAADRTFFFIMSWTAENKRMTDQEFLDWAVSLKPFYTKFVAALSKVLFRQHLMRYFMDLVVKREELEDLTDSSRNDENVVRATMPKAREIARAIVADARVMHSLDITAWFNPSHLREAIKRHDGPRTRVEPSQVMMEFERAGVIEKMDGDYRRFKWGYGRLLEKFGQAHNLPILNVWCLKPGDDWIDNTVVSVNGGVRWRGKDNDQKTQSYERRYEVDPDFMEPE